ncbi:hypothetical protein ABT391_12930 [Streptomyces jumonjinensis]|uniref:hypothetical protein n=1 Tax=Streptomyces jumonjinensis TaxID=1945 RepID=UPI003330276E
MAWTMATGAAVTLSWWGVHTVMSGTAYDAPRALPINADTETEQAAKPQVSSTQRPPSRTAKQPPATGHSGVSKAPEGTIRPSATPSAGTASKDSKTPMASESSGASEITGNVKTYTVDGGRVVFDMAEKTATLASATPNTGWEMRVWKQDYWIRVTFTKDGREESVICTWFQIEPTVSFDER